jgi:hypothetical protein
MVSLERRQGFQIFSAEGLSASEDWHGSVPRSWSSVGAGFRRLHIEAQLAAHQPKRQMRLPLDLDGRMGLSLSETVILRQTFPLNLLAGLIGTVELDARLFEGLMVMQLDFKAFHDDFPELPAGLGQRFWRFRKVDFGFR